MKIEPSLSFKKSVRKTVLSIIIFAFTYLLLLLIAIGITVGFTFLGGWLFLLKPMFYTGLICLGLFATGLSVLYFVIKFVFASTKVDRSNLIEINEEEEPQLFQLIRDVVAKVDTQFPKKVFLDAQVNASVFYDSSFWSMFVPIRKNLLIGVGLINSVTQQELKAILAHEFGHFSQRSMKVGSYVYHVNQIIYNMLYNNESMNKMFEKWDNISGYSAIFIGIAAFIIRQIQAILNKLYGYVNVNYLALSREMEFHADEIAAHVAGSKALADSLLRLSFANHALQGVLSFYQGKISSNIRTQNIYPEHSIVMELLAHRFKCKVDNGFPQIEVDQLARIYRSKLNINNQWASHPSDEDRIKALGKLGIEVSEPLNRPAIELLHNQGLVATRISSTLFNDQFYEGTPTQYTLPEFQSSFLSYINQNEFDERFNGFYESGDIVVELGSLEDTNTTIVAFDELFTEQRIEALSELETLKNDKSILEAIVAQQIVIKTFDYEGYKYNLDQAPTLLQQIEDQIQQKEKETKQYAAQAYHYFRALALQQNEKDRFDENYNLLKAKQQDLENNLKLHQEISSNSTFIFEIHSFEDIEAKLSDLSRREITLKKELEKLLANPELLEKLEGKEKSDLEKYAGETLQYFHVDQYHDENLGLLMNAIGLFERLSLQQAFLEKKNLLKFNLQLHENAIKQAAS